MVESNNRSAVAASRVNAARYNLFVSLHYMGKKGRPQFDVRRPEKFRHGIATPSEALRIATLSYDFDTAVPHNPEVGIDKRVLMLGGAAMLFTAAQKFGEAVGCHVLLEERLLDADPDVVRLSGVPSFADRVEVLQRVRSLQ